MTMTTEAAGGTSQKLTVPCPHCTKLNRIDASRVAAGPKCGACGRAIALDHPVTLTDGTFDRVINGTDLPVFVDFYADWCGPCKMMAPAVDELARTTIGQTLVAKVDTEASPLVAQRFQIRGIPTSIVFRGGREVKRQSGAVPLATLRALVG